MERVKKIHVRKSQGFKIIVFFMVVFACLQIWLLFSNYKEIITKIPEDLFVSPTKFPVSELIVDASYAYVAGTETDKTILTNEDEGNKKTLEEVVETTAKSANGFELSEVQKK